MDANRRATVSLLMIVRNEQHQLAECLASVASLFDEIVIVDTGSSDRTREVAHRFTSHVFDFAWCDDFSAARNEALSHAQGDWVFWLDADDRIETENIERLRRLLAQLDERPQMFFMNTSCASRYACEGVNLITHVRLFRRHADLGWQGRVHEQLRLQPGAPGYELIWSDVQIQHVGYQDATVVQRKLNRDVRLLRMDYAINPENPATLLHLGRAYLHLGQLDQAREFLQRLLCGAETTGEHLRQVHGALATISMHQGEWHTALAMLAEAVRIFPDDEYLQYLSANCLYELDQFEEVKQVLTRIINGPTGPHYYGGLPGDIREKQAPRKLADVLRLHRNFAAAEAILRNVVNQFPDDTHSWYMLGRVYLDWQKGEKLQDVVDRLSLCPQGEIFGTLLLATWKLQQDQLDVAQEAIERLIGLAPQLPMGRVLRAELLAKLRAPVPQQIQACRDILRLLPGHGDARRMLAALEATQAAQRTKPDAGASSVMVGAGQPLAAGVS